MNDSMFVLVREAATQLRDRLLEAERQLSDGHARVDVEHRVRVALDACLARLAETECWGLENRMPSHELWRIAGPLLKLGSLQLAARTKPRGYAGDYPLLDRICRRVCCDDPLGNAMDGYFQDQAAPRAVRQRVRRLSRMIVRVAGDRPLAQRHLVSVGSGPATEIELALNRLSDEQRSRMRVTLLDLDPDALDYAATALQPLLPARQLVCLQANPSRLTSRSGAGQGGVEQQLAGADLLYCAGFFDYLEDQPAIELLTLFWRSLAPGGRAVVYNFTPSNPSRAYMEWIGNWYLKYRRPDELRRLARAAGVADGQLAMRTLVGGSLAELVAHKNSAQTA